MEVKTWEHLGGFIQKVCVVWEGLKPKRHIPAMMMNEDYEVSIYMFVWSCCW